MIKDILLLVILLSIFVNGKTQTLRELEERKTKTEENIKVTEQLLEQTSKEKEKSINHISLLRKQLDLRKNLINDIEAQIGLLEIEIKNKTLLVSSYEVDLRNLKKEHAKLIRFAQKNKSDMSILVFLFASNDFNQAYRRLRFYQQFLKFREQQALDIKTTKQAIENELNEIANNKRTLAQNKDSKAIEITKINSEEKSYSTIIRKLQQNEKLLRKELEERKKAMETLDKAIRDIIEEEAKKIAAQKVDKVRDARYLQLSKGFVGNKGKMPWPASSSIVVSEFGEHNHPVLKGVKVMNNGIDISTKKGEKVKAIFDGEITKIVSIPGQNLAVIIRHGDFLTVYSNLINVQVKMGDKIKTQSIIGEVYSDTKTERSIFNLQIWKENIKLNPADWILP